MSPQKPIDVAVELAMQDKCEVPGQTRTSIDRASIEPRSPGLKTTER